MFLSAAVFSSSAILASLKAEPFHTWFYCFAWWSYILFLEGFLHSRGGASLLFRRPSRFLLQSFWSITIWLVFEAFNFRLQNWHYLQVPSQTSLRWLGYTISFATVLPGILSTSALLDFLGFFKTVRPKPLRSPTRLYKPFLLAGVAFCLLPLALPRVFFPLVWLAFIFLLEPLNHFAAFPSLIGEWSRGSLRTSILLLASGICCGLLWELWNFWAGARWFYTIPYLASPKIFEMPLAGFLGFPPFAVECYVMANCLSFPFDGGAERLDRTERIGLRMFAGCAMAVFDILVYLGIDRFTVVSYFG